MLPVGVLHSSFLLSRENGGIRQSNEYPSSRSKRNVPLQIKIIIEAFKNTLHTQYISKVLYKRKSIFITSILENLGIWLESEEEFQIKVNYHMCPDGACKLMWLLYWKAGCWVESRGSWPTTPRPLTVSKVPDRLNIRQCRSRNWTFNSQRFSKRIQ